MYSNRDRHLVLKGLVDLAFILMATENKSKTCAHPSCQLGIKVLQKIMKKHHETVAIVFQTLIDKIIGGGLYISQYTGKSFMSFLNNLYYICVYFYYIILYIKIYYIIYIAHFIHRLFDLYVP